MKRLVATLACAGIALTACSGNEAATVNGDVISLSDVEAVQKDIESSGAQVANIDALIASLVSSEAASDVIKERGIRASADSRKQTLEGLGLSGEMSEQTQKLVDFYSLAVESQAGGLTDEDIAAINESITSADVEINPRFGQWDSSTGSIGAFSPEYRVR